MSIETAPTAVLSLWHGEILRPANAARTMRSITQHVAERYGLTVADLKRPPGGPRKIARIRQEAMWLMRQVMRADGVRHRYSTLQIGAFFGRDHSTVLHALSAYEARRTPQMDVAA